MNKLTLFLFLIIAASADWANAAAGFGQRNDAKVPVPAEVLAAPESKALPAESLPESLSVAPGATADAGWEKISFKEAETALLASFKKDASALKERVSDLVILDVRVTGEGLPSNYRSQLKGQLERVLVESESIAVKDCPACMVGRFSRNAQGDWVYQNGSQSTDPAKAVGATHALIAEADYSPENFELRVRIVRADSSSIIWSKAYSTQEEARKAEAAAHGEDPNGNQLGQRLIGEIAFTVVVSSGITFMPGLSSGGLSADMLPYPQVSLLLGEKFDRGSKAFGLKVNALVGIPTGGAGSLPPPYYVGAGPAFKWTLNPWERRSPRWSFEFEGGALISSNVATAYAGIGAEMLMMERFSISAVPMFIIPGSVGSPPVMVDNGSGTFQQMSSPALGKVGGFALSLLMKFNW